MATGLALVFKRLTNLPFFLKRCFSNVDNDNLLIAKSMTIKSTNPFCSHFDVLSLFFDVSLSKSSNRLLLYQFSEKSRPAGVDDVAEERP